MSVPPESAIRDSTAVLPAGDSPKATTQSISRSILGLTMNLLVIIYSHWLTLQVIFHHLLSSTYPIFIFYHRHSTVIWWRWPEVPFVLFVVVVFLLFFYLSMIRFRSFFSFFASNPMFILIKTPYLYFSTTFCLL